MTQLPPLNQTELDRTDLGGNGNLNLNTSLDVDDDLLDGLGGGKQATTVRNNTLSCTGEYGNVLYETLVDAHLVLVPGLRTLTVGGLTSGDLKALGGQTDGTLDLEGLGAGTVNELRAHLLEGGDLARREGDTDLVDLLYMRKRLALDD